MAWLRWRALIGGVRMTTRHLHYSVGNEHSPTNPWGRSELVIEADGTARLDHVFSRPPSTGAWTGRVDAEALDRLWAALATAGFPAAPSAPFPPGSTLRQLTVDTDGTSEAALV